MHDVRAAMHFLSEAFQEQSMVLPSGGLTSAHASSSIEDDVDLEVSLESLAREKLAHDSSGLNAASLTCAPHAFFLCPPHFIIGLPFCLLRNRKFHKIAEKCIWWESNP